MSLQKILKSGYFTVLRQSKILRKPYMIIRTLSTESETGENDTIDERFYTLTKEIESCLLPQTGQRVLILQPSRTHGILKLKSGNMEQSLLEARALVNTLRSWTLVDEEIANTRIIRSKTFFSSGNYEKLTENFRERKDITAIFVNFQCLSALQIMTLERDWQKVVYDRYMMVLQIFKLHAHTAESKLQVQIAELPYYRSRLYGFHIRSHSNATLNHLEKSLNSIGINKSSFEEKYDVIKEMEHKLKGKIKDLEVKRDINKSGRRNSILPVISVLGYTNAGKSSLIKVLTRDEKIEPKNCYFATLDVTYHDFYLKLNENDYVMKTLLIDTIGFMSDIPTNLISAFRSTLKDTIDTDLLIHVVDISNEYWKVQMDFTLQTLRAFNLPEKLLNSIITVGTKIDCIDRLQLEDIKSKISNFIPVSNKTGENVDLLHTTINESLQKNINFVTKRLKVSQGSNIYQWVQSNGVITNQQPSMDGEKLLIEVLFLPNIWAKFQNLFYERK